MFSPIATLSPSIAINRNLNLGSHSWRHTKQWNTNRPLKKSTYHSHVELRYTAGWLAVRASSSETELHHWRRFLHSRRIGEDQKNCPEQTKATTTKSSLPPAAATRTGSSAQFSDPNAAIAAAAAKKNEIDAEQIRVSTSRDLVRLGTTGSEGLGSAARLACCLQGGNMFDVPDRNAGHPRSRNRVRETSTS